MLMKFLFIFNSPGILGGIETLIVRTSRWLLDQGHQVSLLTYSSENWEHLLPAGVRVITLGERYRELYYYLHAMRLLKELKLEKPDIIKSFDLPASWIACQLASLCGPKCKVIAGIYNPAVFKWYYGAGAIKAWEARRLYLANYLNNIPQNARIFCGVDQITELEEVHQQKGQLWPLPLDTSQFEPACRKAKRGEIVSIGRLSPMKEYNLYMIDVVQELRKRGNNVTWTVYGTGEYEAQMREKIEKLGMGNAIFLKGTLPYKAFWKALENAWVFVGMGTAILEASFFGVPNVCAVAYDSEGLTWGPVHRLPRGSLSPAITCLPRLRVVDEIERILRLSAADYEAEEKMVSTHVQVHDLRTSMNRCMEIVREAEPIRRAPVRYLANYPLWLLHKALGSEHVVHHPDFRQVITE